jgi:ribosomal protein S18 acetylase RimI-like enzyme
MIRKLNLREPNEVQSLLNIQRLAYRIEADLIGFNDIPTLKDTIYSMQECNETFYGYFDNTMLCGAISYTREGETVDICRLFVHPERFRQGIGKALVKKVLEVENDASKFTVSTGSKNTPAVILYQQLGFVETGRTEISDGVYLSHFERTNH